MLKKLSFENYTTFIEKTTIDIEATNYKFLEQENVGDERVLKGLLFVGENASGKTKIINSIKLLLDLLFGTDEILFGNFKSFYTEEETYKLKYNFVFDGKDIEYKIEFDFFDMISEKLVYDNKVIIERMGKTAKFCLKEEKIFNDVSLDSLFLRRIYFDTKFYDEPILTKWYMYLKNSIYINCYDRVIIDYGKNGVTKKEYLKNHDSKEINDFLKKINYNQRVEFAGNSLNEEKTTIFVRNNTNIAIFEPFESTGNKTLIQMIPPFLNVINGNAMLLIDEFSSGFHNELEECLLKYFFHYAKNSQIFLVSHSTNLLNNTILRPDQIYSVTFIPKKGSVVKRFSDESPRESQNTEKMYLNGVFNGMPNYPKRFDD